jgi:hypothetical protein
MGEGQSVHGLITSLSRGQGPRRMYGTNGLRQPWTVTNGAARRRKGWAAQSSTWRARCHLWRSPGFPGAPRDD